ncbi:hypothetical protein AB0467_35545 [Streptomyces sp. NPDC052095]|uniref:hypothetical protein n=1 Tax=unclassified Streptomyces TaxID=2593676 RepID=UPI00344DE0BA
MTIKKTAPQAIHASSFGERKGFISPRGAFLERRDEGENRYIVFTLVVFAQVDEFFAEDLKRREFEVWTQGEDVKTLQAAFPKGMNGVSKEEAAVIVDVADEWYENYKNEEGKWVHVVKIRARSITLPNITD